MFSAACRVSPAGQFPVPTKREEKRRELRLLSMDTAQTLCTFRISTALGAMGGSPGVLPVALLLAWSAALVHVSRGYFEVKPAAGRATRNLAHLLLAPRPATRLEDPTTPHESTPGHFWWCWLKLLVRIRIPGVCRHLFALAALSMHLLHVLPRATAGGQRSASSSAAWRSWWAAPFGRHMRAAGP